MHTSNLHRVPPTGEPGLVRGAFVHFSVASRLGRGALFRSLFDLGPSTRVLDLGGADGSHVNSVLADTPVLPGNVHVADISRPAVEMASARFGYSAVVISESGSLPFPDKFFDVVFCSSVLEHVTLAKEDVWRETSGARFARAARARQARFANEISRIGHGYFVQVPYRWFPIETHTWLPFFGCLPRAVQCPLIRVSNRFWIKMTMPDFYLPTAADMAAYFPQAEIRRERFFGMTKSLIAVKRPGATSCAALPA